MDRCDVAIAGAGIIGLATALELAAHGRKVTVFDQGEAMSEASRAAAGMLAGADPENPPELNDLARLSLSLYPQFLARVESLSKKSIPIRTHSAIQGLHHAPRDAQSLSASDLLQRAPHVHPNDWQFVLLHETSFDAWDLAEALPDAARAAGIDLREHTQVRSARSTAAGVEIVTDAGTYSAAAFLNATGAWSPALEPALPVMPRKGHMLTVELPGPAQMDCVLRIPGVYIVPRGNNRYTIGSTVEDAGFDRTVDPLRIHELFNRAADLWPPLREATIAETWVGLRPGSPDGLPILDQTGENSWVATGHFRNGILLGPGTGRILSQCILGQKPDIDIAPFRLARFVAAPVS
ncbi:MAG TPA: FAD-dependent oxidoreductase [Acidobacteriaceae bacterium]|nr:FAD-dependent oxidoreductase [Acidobacteriaceae bacterium]